MHSLNLPVRYAVTVVQRQLLQHSAATAECYEAFISEQLTGQAVALEEYLQYHQLLAVRGQGLGQVISHAPNTAGTLINGQVPQVGAHRNQGKCSQAHRVGQYLVVFVTIAKSLLALCLPGFLRPMQSASSKGNTNMIHGLPINASPASQQRLIAPRCKQ
jgi:hypothetical protein